MTESNKLYSSITTRRNEDNHIETHSDVSNIEYTDGGWLEFDTDTSSEIETHKKLHATIIQYNI